MSRMERKHTLSPIPEGDEPDAHAAAAAMQVIVGVKSRRREEDLLAKRDRAKRGKTDNGFSSDSDDDAPSAGVGARAIRATVPARSLFFSGPPHFGPKAAMGEPLPAMMGRKPALPGLNPLLVAAAKPALAASVEPEHDVHTDTSAESCTS